MAERSAALVMPIILLSWVGFSADASLAATPETANERPPNIVLFLIDDLGWMDLACQGNRRVDTPHIDRLAAQGMRFTDAYAAAPVCSPTRAAILTGLSPARLHLTTHIPDRPQFTPEGAVLSSATTRDRLPLEHVTVGERLRAAGYSTAFLGKWHLSGRGDAGDPKFYPERQGFDVNLGGCALGGPPTFFDPYRIPTLKNRRPGEYLPDRLADEAVSFLREKRAKPFLLFLWHYTVHWPMEAPKALLEKYADRKGPGLRDIRYGAMIEALDGAVGRVLGALEELELANDTMVIFTSDNGGYSGVADNRPLRSGKGYLYEGGIRVPWIVRWPGRIAPGSISRAPVISTDLYPTILAAAQLHPDVGLPSDGENLLPILTAKGRLKRDAIYFHYPNYAWHRSNRLGGAVRQGRYKLIENFDDGSVELYDLAEDIAESRDLASELPQIASKLRAKLHRWRTETKAVMPQRRAVK